MHILLAALVGIAPIYIAIQAIPDGTFHTQVTPSLLLLLLLAMPLLPGLYWLWCRSRRAAFRRTGDAWACGYSWENAMAPSGNGATRCGGRCLRGLLGLRLRVFIQRKRNLSEAGLRWDGAL